MKFESGPSSVSPTPEKNNYASFEDCLEAIEKGDLSIRAFDLENARDNGYISESEFHTLTLKLLKREQQIMEGDWANRDVDPQTGARTDLIPQLEKIIKELEYSPERRAFPVNAIMAIGIDIRGLKTLNDTYGHTFGDKVIEMYFQHLKDSTREWGRTLVIRNYKERGDEFYIILQIREGEDVSDEGLQKVYESVVERANSMFIETDGEQNPISIKAQTKYSVLRKGESKTAQELKDEADPKKKQ